jgi:hypothetical protein
MRSYPLPVLWRSAETFPYLVGQAPKAPCLRRRSADPAGPQTIRGGKVYEACAGAGRMHRTSAAGHQPDRRRSSLATNCVKAPAGSKTSNCGPEWHEAPECDARHRVSGRESASNRRTLAADRGAMPLCKDKRTRGCCQTNANQSPLPQPLLSVRQREGRATLRERRRGSACRCRDSEGGAPLGSGCGPRHGLRRTSVTFAYAGNATSTALVVGTAGANSLPGC